MNKAIQIVIMDLIFLFLAVVGGVHILTSYLVINFLWIYVLYGFIAVFIFTGVGVLASRN